MTPVNVCWHLLVSAWSIPSSLSLLSGLLTLLADVTFFSPPSHVWLLCFSGLDLCSSWTNLTLLEYLSSL